MVQQILKTSSPARRIQPLVEALPHCCVPRLAGLDVVERHPNSKPLSGTEQLTLLCFDDILDLLDFLSVSADDPKAVDVSSISSDGHTPSARLVAGRSHFVLKELAKRQWCSLSDVFLRHSGHVHRTERRLQRRRPACRGGRGQNAGRRGTPGDVCIRWPSRSSSLSLHSLKLQPSVLELATGLGKLLSRLRQFFGQLGRHFGNLLCHIIPKFS